MYIYIYIYIYIYTHTHTYIHDIYRHWTGASERISSEGTSPKSILAAKNFHAYKYIHTYMTYTDTGLEQTSRYPPKGRARSLSWQPKISSKSRTQSPTIQICLLGATRSEFLCFDILEDSESVCPDLPIGSDQK